MDNPIDELNVQLPGRMLTAEILLTLMLQKQSKAGQFLKAADERLTQLEASLAAESGHSEYALQVFAAARASLETFIVHVRPRG